MRQDKLFGSLFDQKVNLLHLDILAGGLSTHVIVCLKYTRSNRKRCFECVVPPFSRSALGQPGCGARRLRYWKH